MARKIRDKTGRKIRPRVYGGDYRSQIEIYKRTYTSNGYGGFTQEWTLVDTVWCNVETTGGAVAYKHKTERYGMVYPTEQYIIRMRYRPDLNTENRLFYDGKWHKIFVALDRDNRKYELEVITEVVKDGQDQNPE